MCRGGSGTELGEIAVIMEGWEWSAGQKPRNIPGTQWRVTALLSRRKAS